MGKLHIKAICYMRIKLSIRIQIVAWLMYWTQLLIVNLLYFKDTNYTRPLLILWTVLYTLCGITIFFVLTKIYSYLISHQKNKSLIISTSALLCLFAAYIWGVFEPIISWLINPNIKNLIIQWDINSRHTFSITFVLAFFSLLFYYFKIAEQKESENTISTEEKNPDAISFYSKNEIITLPIKDIKRISVAGNYSSIIDCKNQKFELKKSLKKWEEELPPNSFKRIHRAIIINANFIEKIENWDNYTIRIKLIGIDKPEEVSRRYSAILKKQMKL